MPLSRLDTEITIWSGFFQVWGLEASPCSPSLPNTGQLRGLASLLSKFSLLSLNTSRENQHVSVELKGAFLEALDETLHHSTPTSSYSFFPVPVEVETERQPWQLHGFRKSSTLFLRSEQLCVVKDLRPKERTSLCFPVSETTPAVCVGLVLEGPPTAK